MKLLYQLLLNQIPKWPDILTLEFYKIKDKKWIIMGGLNYKIGKERVEYIVEDYGLGDIN